MRPEYGQNPNNHQLNHTVFERFARRVLIRQITDIGRLGVKVQHIHLIDHEYHRQAKTDQIPIVSLRNRNDDGEQYQRTRGFTFTHQGGKCKYTAQTGKYNQLTQTVRVNIGSMPFCVELDNLKGLYAVLCGT